MQTINSVIDVNSKHLKVKEWILYLMAAFFYTNMTGMSDSYRSAYLTNVLLLENSQVALFNTLVSIIPFILGFFITLYIDGRKIGKGGKFRPLALISAIPLGVLLILTFWTPKAFTGTLTLIYVTTIAILWSVMCSFGNTVNSVSFVMTPNMKERDNLISFKSIATAVGNSAPLVIVLVLGIFFKDEGTQYIISASLCSVIGVVTILLGMSTVKERVVYNETRKNPLIGIVDILRNKYAWVIIISEFLKTFRKISTYMGVFLAAALLGSTSKYLLFGLPTGIGTAVGMLVINFLLKKFNSKVLYIASGIYSVLINTAAFAVGYIYFQSGTSALQIVFIVFLFLIGLQFGASNLLPNMFQADVLEDVEYKTGKRLDASLPFVINIGTMISGAIATALAPMVLYGDNSIIGYVPNADEQTLKSKILLLFFYTVVHGIMMFLAGVPFFFYKFTGKTKEAVHAAVIENRQKMLEKENSASDSE